MRVPVLLLAVAAAGMVAAGPTTHTLVLVGGETLSGVVAEVQDGFVWVDHGGGRRQAFALQDVDLAASGLVPEAATAAPGGTAGHPPTIGSDRDFSVTIPPPPASKVVITDADVEHVVPELLAEDGAGDIDGPATLAPLAATSVRHKVNDTRLNVTGMVSNHTTAPATGVTVTVVALAENGAILGTASTELRQPIPGGGTAPFSVVVDDAAAAVKVDAQVDGRFPEGTDLDLAAPPPAAPAKVPGNAGQIPE